MDDLAKPGRESETPVPTADVAAGLKAVSGDRSDSVGDPSEPASTVQLPPAGSNLPLAILATVAVVFALEWAQYFIISLLLGILFAYTLNPLVAWLERIRIPRLVGTCVVMLGVVCAVVLGTYSLQGQVQTILDKLPEAVNRVASGLTAKSEGQPSTLEKVQSAASAIEKATRQESGTGSTPKQATTHVVIDTPGFKVENFLWSGSMGAAGLVGQASMVLFLTFFLLLSGNTYKRKLVRLTGPSLSNKKITVQVLDDINDSIQRYLFMLLTTNVMVGLSTWIALRWIGLDNGGAWAVAAGLLHIIPYFGPAATAVCIGVAAFLQFNELSTALLVAGASVTIATIVGTFVTTWMTGRIAKMNKTAVFVSVLFWTWLWGIWGMLLSIPITVIVKVVAQRVDKLEPVAELIGD